ncbi:MAG TPA: AMP-binding protein [Acidobacteriaceae bacterium]|nr:AMP-binding protein [Acidobacteriaceae bacterium]
MRTHLASLVEDFRQHASEIAVVAHRGSRRYATSYGQLAELAGRFAAELNARGIVAGERVVVWGENSAEWMAIFFGCLLRGVLAVPLDAAGAAEFAGRVIADVSARLIVGDARLLEQLGSLGAGEKEIPRLDLAEMWAALPTRPDYSVSESVHGDVPFQIVFTSGTTAEPKGVVLTHRNVLASLGPIEKEIGKYRKYERVFHPLRFLHTVPLSHVFGQFMALWTPALLASEVHFVDRTAPGRMVELMRRERISVLVSVPRILQMLRAHLLGSFAGLDGAVDAAETMRIWRRWWRFRAVHRALGWKFWAVISGGAALPGEQEEFWNRLGFALIQGYGMTETTALVTLNHPFHIGQGTIGKPLPGREVKISESGEILVRGDVLAAGTWRNGAMERREEEWLATGDLAQQSETGEITFLGRKGDVIVTGAGMNVHPEDLEQEMLRQPGVRGCCVVPCAMTTGPEPVAVALFAGSDAELQARVAEANRGLAEYQQIRRVLRWPELQFPYTSTGKLQRRKVANWVCKELGNQMQEMSAAADSNGDALLEMIAEVTGEPVMSGGDALLLSEDLHLDSLGRVQLQAALEERLSVTLAEDVVASAVTLGELRTLLGKRAGEAAGEFTKAGGASSAAPFSEAGVQAPVSQAIGPLRRERDAGEQGEEHLYPRWPWSWPVRLLRAGFLECVVRPLVWLLGAPKVVVHAKALPEGPALVIANHVTAYDGPLVVYALPGKLRRRMAVAMSGEMLLDFRKGRRQGNALKNLLGPAAYFLATALFNVFPLPRLRGFQRSFAHAGEAMDRGFSVLVFPEGARSADARLHGFRAGIGLLMEQTRVPVIPVALVGLGDAPAGQRRWFRTGRVEIHVGEPIADAGKLSSTERTQRLEERIRRMLEDAGAKNVQ